MACKRNSIRRQHRYEMFCLDIKVKNVFTEGCTDFQRSTLTRHASLDAHCRAIEIGKSKGSILKSFQRVGESASDSLSCQLRSAYFMVKNNIALHIYPELMELMKRNGCQQVFQSGCYVSHDAVSDMVHCFSDSLNEDLLKQIKESKFIGILINESCDIAIFKKLILYIQTVVNGKAK